jgi:hypothetical protein
MHVEHEKAEIFVAADRKQRQMQCHWNANDI